MHVEIILDISTHSVPVNLNLLRSLVPVHTNQNQCRPLFLKMYTLGHQPRLRSWQAYYIHNLFLTPLRWGVLTS